MGSGNLLLKRERIGALVLAVVLVLPSLVWIVLDTSAWGGDQSQYGFATLELFHTLTHNPGDWPARLLNIFPYKPNGLIWLGQLFVPLAFVLPSVDIALLLSTLLLQVVTLLLLFKTLRVLAPLDRIIAVTGCLIVAAAPLFVLFAHYYLVESLQVMSAAWFILIMALAPTWNRSLLLGQLVGASVVAIAAKQIQPLFCLWPGLVASFYLIRSTAAPGANLSQSRLTIASWLFAVPLTILTGAWYYTNWASVYSHLVEGTYGQGVKTLWGKEDTYFNTAFFWAEALRSVNFLPVIADASLILVLGAVAIVAIQPKRSPTHMGVCAVAAGLQIVTVLMVFSLSPTRQFRYLLPVLPALALLITWALTQYRRRWATIVTCGVFATQFVLLHGQALSLWNPVSQWVRPLEIPSTSGPLLNAIVDRTCVSSPKGKTWNIIAIEPSMPEIRGDWLAPDPANFVVAKNRFRTGGDLPCHYGYFGEGFFGADVATAWDTMLGHQTEFVILADPAKYTTPPQVFNKALSQENFPQVLRRFETSGLYRLEQARPADAGVLIFRRVSGVPSVIDRINSGRALTDRGLHDQAIAELRNATTSAPTNVEAWANLAYAYERAGRFEEAIDAGMEVRKSNPRHHYVNLLMARAYSGLGRWRDVVTLAGEASVDAPGPADRVNALTLAAKGAFRLGQSQEGCALLRQAGLPPTGESVGETGVTCRP
jgi:hypothetical protein